MMEVESSNRGSPTAGSTSPTNSKRQSTEASPGRVLFLRNLARGVTDQDLSGLVGPFCQCCPPKLYIQSMKGQAFVEFPSVECASKCLEFLSAHPTPLKGTNVAAAFSSRKTVTTQEDLISSLEQTSRVLLVHVVEMMYPVDIDMLHHIFSKHGVVEKIVTFSRDQRAFQAMIQFDTPQAATEALRVLDNQNIYNDCNTLKIQFSTFKELTVKYNNSRSRDFTNPNLPSGFEGEGQRWAWDRDDPSRWGVPQGGLPSGYPGAYPMQDVGGSLSRMGSGAAITTSGGYLSPQGSGGWIPPMSSAINLVVQIGASALMNVQHTPVVIVYGLDSELANCDHLFNLFSFYGVVTRVKLLVKRPDAALVQFQIADYATLALNFLQGVHLYGKQLRIAFSNNKEITVAPTNGTSDSNLKTKVYLTKSQRYGMNVHEKTIKNVCRPSCSLHVANVSLETTEEELLLLFSEHGTVTPGGFKWLTEKESRKETPVKMALIQMANSGDATTALANLHNYNLNGRTMKVSYSKQSLCS